MIESGVNYIDPPHIMIESGVNYVNP